MEQHAMIGTLDTDLPAKEGSQTKLILVSIIFCIDVLCSLIIRQLVSEL